MNTHYITNINTLSALLDRLIVENIKLYFFIKENLHDNVTHQTVIISQIKEKIKELFVETYTAKEYNYIEEKRTYKYDAIIETLNELIISNITTGQADRNNLNESLSPSPSVDVFQKNHKLLRKANEHRSFCKNQIDSLYKNIIEDEKND